MNRNLRTSLNLLAVIGWLVFGYAPQSGGNRWLCGGAEPFWIALPLMMTISIGAAPPSNLVGIGASLTM